MAWFEGFEARRFPVNGVEIFARIGGTPGKPPLLLLHGFPQTHVLWHRVARQLAADYTLVLPDLRGYGDSSRPPGLPDHANYSKREMARDMVGVMQSLGHERFYACGHDRGGRVAHRLAVDHPERVERLCVIDIAPTLDMYAATDMAFARGYYHWFHLIQSSPLPETMIGGNPRAYLHTKLGGWGSGGSPLMVGRSRMYPLPSSCRMVKSTPGTSRFAFASARLAVISDMCVETWMGAALWFSLTILSHAFLSAS